jgi:hypothetical protein
MQKSVVAFCAVLISMQTSIASAASATGYSDAEVREADRAVLSIPTSPTFNLALDPTPASDMPAWDPIAHYVGRQSLPEGIVVYAVLVDERYRDAITDLPHAARAVQIAIASAAFLAVMDSGQAGSAWMARYSQAADADSQLAASVSDRYANRHALVRTLAETQTNVYSSIGGAGSPSMDDFGNPLTEPIDYGNGLLRFARLGAAGSRLVELLEYAPALQEPFSQTFVDKWFSEFSDVLPSDRRAQLAQLRPLFVNPSTDNIHAREVQFNSAILSLLGSLPSDESSAWGIGYDANEIRYNADRFKSADEDYKLRTLLSRYSDLDADVPHLAALRQQIGALQPGDWTTIAKVAGQIVDLIVKGH